MPFFAHDQIDFHFRAEGVGIPVLWQHGLGSDIDQTFALLGEPIVPTLARHQFVGFDVRGHGRTSPLGDPRKVSFAQFADDLRAFLDHRRIEKVVLGGISMGAALALRFANAHPERALGLVLSRPAWLDRPLPVNLRIFTHIAGYLLNYGPQVGLERFRQTPEFQSLQAEAPDSAQVVVNNFLSPHALEYVARLERLPNDAPTHDRSAWRTLDFPALVLANHQDPIHPWDLAETLAALLPNSELVEITSKSISIDRHAADVRRALGEFLDRHWGEGN